jgi:Ser/Thr protein kinase RdoA (MazF antagonist)
MDVPPVSTTFTSTRAEQLAHEAAAMAGLAHERAELIRLGSSAVLRLPGGVVARVARDESWIETSAHEVRVATALHRAGVPCVRPWPVPQPVTVDGHPVTFWAEIPGPLQRPTFAELGTVLRQLHTVHANLDLPPLDPWARTPERVEHAPVSASQRRVLADVLAEVQDAWPTARFELAAGAIHGDAHLGNLVRGTDGAVVLVDFDSACIGPREWDLAPTGLYAASLGWISRAEYQAFVAAYGFDVTTAPAFPLLARMRELRMTAWLAMHAAESERVAAEVAHRIACLADPELPRHWSAR